MGFSVFFFFKQKTAYEMRISDWSSDVCSSDLPALAWAARGRGAAPADRGLHARAAGRDRVRRPAHCAGGADGRGAGGARGSTMSLPRTAATHGDADAAVDWARVRRSEEHTSEIQSLMRNSYAVFSLTEKNKKSGNQQMYKHQ